MSTLGACQLIAEYRAVMPLEADATTNEDLALVEASVKLDASACADCDGATLPADASSDSRVDGALADAFRVELSTVDVSLADATMPTGDSVDLYCFSLRQQFNALVEQQSRCVDATQCQTFTIRDPCGCDIPLSGEPTVELLGVSIELLKSCSMTCIVCPSRADCAGGHCLAVL